MAVENTDEVVKLIWRAASVSDSIALRESIRIFRDDWQDIVESKINSVFQDPQTKARLAPLISTEINLCKKIIMECAMIYREAADRSAMNGETEDERYSEIVKESRINTVMQSVNRYTELVNHVLVRPIIRKGKMEYDVILPDQFEIFTDEDDWKDIIAIRYFTGCPDGGIYDAKAGGTTLSRKRGYIWVKKRSIMSIDGIPKIMEPGVYEFDYSKSRDPWIESEFPYQYEGENVLPFMLTYKEYPIETLLNFTQDSAMPDSAVMIAVLLTYLNEVIKYQSFVQLVVTGDTNMQLPAKMPSGAGTIYKILSEGASGDIKAIDVKGPIAELTDTIMKRAQMIASQYGIPPSAFTLTGTPQSGYAMKMDRNGLEERRKNSIENYREFERELFHLTRIVNNTDHNKKIADNAEFHIDFAEPDFAPSPQEEAVMWNGRIAANVATPIDWIKSDNPDLTDEEAQEKHLKNKFINNPSASLSPLTIGKPPVEPT